MLITHGSQDNSNQFSIKVITTQQENNSLAAPRASKSACFVRAKDLVTFKINNETENRNNSNQSSNQSRHYSSSQGGCLMSSSEGNKSAKDVDQFSQSNGSDLGEERRPERPIITNFNANKKRADQLSDLQIQNQLTINKYAKPAEIFYYSLKGSGGNNFSFFEHKLINSNDNLFRSIRKYKERIKSLIFAEQIDLSKIRKYQRLLWRAKGMRDHKLDKGDLS